MNRFNYTIEKRVFRDIHWLKGWFSGMKPSWGPWELDYSYTLIDNARKVYELLERQKHKLSYTAEYRLIKEKK